MQVNWMEEAGVTKRSALPALHKTPVVVGDAAEAKLPDSSVVFELAAGSGARPGGQLPEAARVPRVQARCLPACLLSGPLR